MALLLPVGGVAGGLLGEDLGVLLHRRLVGDVGRLRLDVTGFDHLVLGHDDGGLGRLFGSQRGAGLGLGDSVPTFDLNLVVCVRRGGPRQ